MNGEAVIKTKEIWKFFMKKMAISFQAECNFGFPVGSDSKESACNAGDVGSIPGLERSLGEVNGNPLSILAQRIPSIEEPWRATIHGVTESDTIEATNLSLSNIYIHVSNTTFQTNNLEQSFVEQN